MDVRELRAALIRLSVAALTSQPLASHSPNNLRALASSPQEYTTKVLSMHGF